MNIEIRAVITQMETENLILKSWQQQEKLFIENLLISRKRPTKDSVHDLRVAIKRMRSYLRLKQEINGEPWKESFAKISVLFKSFGRLRDYDMSLALSRQQERKWNLSLIPFKEYLIVNRALTRRWAKKDAIQFNEQELQLFKPQLNFALTDGEITDKIIQLYFLKIKKVKNLGRHFRKNAHEIRKQLKDVFYWLKICPKESIENLIDIKALDKLLTNLGNWQDYFIFRKKIRQYKKDLPKNNEKETLKGLEKKLVDIQEEHLAKAIKKWKEMDIKKATEMKQSPVFNGAPDGS